ncbi:MAG: hypothetical protein C0490_22645, partial [Marivirga sp.]|nr:hypothetical protein [Marivirga sp.]
MKIQYIQFYIFAILIIFLGTDQLHAQTGPPFAINWVNQIGVSTNGGILTKTVSSAKWTNAGGVSSNILSANTDGWMEFSTFSGADFIIGLAVNNIIDYPEFGNGIRI